MEETREHRLPILLIHGYSSEGRNNSVEAIYGRLPDELRAIYGDEKVVTINLSRWLSLNNRVNLDDIAFAMQRALESKYSQLLRTGFNIIIHSTGALVVRNWLKLFNQKPSPVKRIIYLAGAHFGSGLAHVGRGQLARWGRLILSRTGSGLRILKELEFANWKTLDLQRYFLLPENRPLKEFEVMEFCLTGSQTLPFLRPVPIRYVKEDSSDNTVRTASANLNYHWVDIKPSDLCWHLKSSELKQLLERRLTENKRLHCPFYDIRFINTGDPETAVPFSVLYEIAHFGDDIGIVSGQKNRKQLLKLIKLALLCQNGKDYRRTAKAFDANTTSTLQRVVKLKSSPLDWNKQAQYEAHAQLIFRIRDQYGRAVPDFDIHLRSLGNRKSQKLEQMIEDTHRNSDYEGTMTFYLRIASFDDTKKEFVDRLQNVSAVDIEVTAFDGDESVISYVPLSVHLSAKQLQAIVQPHTTTVIDITLMRLPAYKVFTIKTIR